MSPQVCPEFTPGKDDHHCTCELPYLDHSEEARTMFMINASIGQIQKTVVIDRTACKNYYPCENWIAGQGDVPKCVNCGGARLSHHAGVVLAGIRAYRFDQSPACSKFRGSIETPGKCGVCDKRWIQHEVMNRRGVIEAFYEAHKDWCKCIILNGENPCSCLSDHEIQQKLDALATTKKEVTLVGHIDCKSFLPTQPGNAMCKCGQGFYNHSPIQLEGAKSLYEWRANHMTNSELVVWFQSLPGKGRRDKLDFMKRLLTDPNLHHTPPKDTVSPPLTTMEALMDAIDTASHLIDKKAKQPPSTVLMLVASDILDAGEEKTYLGADPEKHYCHSCGEVEAKMSGALCQACGEALANLADGKASNDRGGS